MTDDGQHAFDFLFGSWHVHHRKLRDVADPDCDEWVEFEARSEAFPILDGVGHIDRIFVPDTSSQDPFEGFTLRLFDASAGTWSIWWSSTRGPGRLDPPVTGRFTGDHGVFEGTDVIGGREAQLRFEWRRGEAPTWQQSFSYDSGATWTLNWVMQFDRSDA